MSAILGLGMPATAVVVTMTDDCMGRCGLKPSRRSAFLEKPLGTTRRDSAKKLDSPRAHRNRPGALHIVRTGTTDHTLAHLSVGNPIHPYAQDNPADDRSPYKPDTGCYPAFCGGGNRDRYRGHPQCRKGFQQLVLRLNSFIQTFPPSAVIILAFPVLGFGWKPALLALFLYSLFLSWAIRSSDSNR